MVVRFAPEMELTGANGWALGRPDAFVAAYRRVVDIFRAEVGRQRAVALVLVAGNDGAEAYYPGRPVRRSGRPDRPGQPGVGPALGLQTTRSFAQLLGEKYRIAQRFGKPLVVAELGVAAGDPAADERWLDEARASFERFPLLRGISYFNARQPKDPPQISVFPDWRLRAPQALFARTASSATR